MNIDDKIKKLKNEEKELALCLDFAIKEELNLRSIIYSFNEYKNYTNNNKHDKDVHKYLINKYIKYIKNYG